MSAFMIFASAMIATQVVALSVLVNDAIRRERNGAAIDARRPPLFSPATTPHADVDRRRVRRAAGAAFERRAA